jgi:hypothetical protein
MTPLATGVPPAISSFMTNGTAQPSFPLTSHAVCDRLEAIMQEPSMPALWIAGRITGWMEAHMENAPQAFKSFVLSERRTALQAL